MDEYDIVDFIYKAIDSVHTGVVIYKDKSDKDVDTEHIVINNLSLNELSDGFICKTPININVFVPLRPNGMVNRPRMKELRRAVRNSLDSINCNDGIFREIEVLYVAKMPDLKENFDCVNIRIEVLTDKN